MEGVKSMTKAQRERLECDILCIYGQLKQSEERMNDDRKTEDQKKAAERTWNKKYEYLCGIGYALGVLGYSFKYIEDYEGTGKPKVFIQS